jgi:hypothetical protein
MDMKLMVIEYCPEFFVIAASSDLLARKKATHPVSLVFSLP